MRKIKTTLIFAFLMCLLSSIANAEKIPSMLYNHGSGEMTVVDGKLYVFSAYSWQAGDGRRLSGADKFEVYDPQTNAWQELAQPPVSSSHSESFIIDNKPYFAGGQIRQDKFSDNLMFYDQQNDSWTVRKLPIPTHSIISTIANEKAYILAGTVGTNYTHPNNNPYIYEYNKDNDTWVNKTTVPLQVSYAPVESYNGKIYIFGGAHHMVYAQNPVLRNEVQIYDPQNDTWSNGAPLPDDFYSSTAQTPEYFFDSVKHGDRAIIFIESKGNLTNNVFVYSFLTDTWEKYDISVLLGTEVSQIQMQNGMALLGNYIYFGSKNGTDVYRYDIAWLIDPASIPAKTHPADANEDWNISQQENENYSNSWKQGQDWNNESIPIDFVTRAGYLWKSGGNYKDTKGLNAKRWAPSN